MTDSTEDRNKAAELFMQARELELKEDYKGARKCYEQSLQLHEDEQVMAAYLELLATIGPL